MRRLALLPFLLSPVGFGCGREPAVAPVTAQTAEKQASPDAGAKVKLSRAEGSGKILIAIDKDSYAALSEWRAKGTEALPSRLTDQKRVFEVEPDTSAEIQESEPGRKLVLILSGPHQNKKGWIASDDVVESR